MATKIEWTTETWNPVTGCSRVSAGCDNCYAMHMARRLDGQGKGYDDTTRRARKGTDAERTDWTGIVHTHLDRLEQPLRWRKPRRVFADSMSDLFHEQVPFDFIDKVFAVMALTPEHDYQILTKRPERMAEYLSAGPELRLSRWPKAAGQIPGKKGSAIDAPTFFESFPENVWLGTSVEDAKALDRADELRGIEWPGVRFLSLEPLLGPLPNLDLARIDWVIAGGESGHGARPMKKQWVAGIRDKCQAAGVPFFFKQWGAYDAAGQKVGKSEAGRTLDGKRWEEFPQMPLERGDKENERTGEIEGLRSEVAELRAELSTLRTDFFRHVVPPNDHRRRRGSVEGSRDDSRRKGRSWREKLTSLFSADSLPFGD